MTDIKPGDEVTVTITSTVSEYGWYRGLMWVEEDNATVEVTKHVNSAANDRVGVVRQEDSCHYPKVKYGPDRWRMIGLGTHNYDDYTDQEVEDCPIIGTVPGSPAAEWEELGSSAIPWRSPEDDGYPAFNLAEENDEADRRMREDAKGWVLTKDRCGEFWAVKGGKYRTGTVDDSTWEILELMDYDYYAPHTPITASKLPQALRDTL